MTDDITRAWEALDRMGGASAVILTAADLDAIRAVLPPKPEPKYAAYLDGDGTFFVENRIGNMRASHIPTRDQAERIAAIYNEEVGE